MDRTRFQRRGKATQHIIHAHHIVLLPVIVCKTPSTTTKIIVAVTVTRWPLQQHSKQRANLEMTAKSYAKQQLQTFPNHVACEYTNHTNIINQHAVNQRKKHLKRKLPVLTST